MTSPGRRPVRLLLAMGALIFLWSSGGAVAQGQSASTISTSTSALALSLDDATLPELESALPTYDSAEAQPSKKSVRLAQSGRFLLAVGVPTLFAGSVVAGTSYIDCDYYDPSNERRWGWAIFGVGAAVSATGIATLVRATKEARRAAKTRKSRIALGLTATFASLAAAAAGVGGSSGNLMCNS